MVSEETCLTPLTQVPIFLQVLVCLPEFGQTLGVTALVQSASVQTGVVERVELVLVVGDDEVEDPGPDTPMVELGVVVEGGVVAGPDTPTVEVVLVGVVVGVEDGTSLLFINPFF